MLIQIGERKDDGTPLQPFDESDPMSPYELPGSRYLFGEPGKVIKAIGRFESRAEGEAALKRVEARRPDARAFLTTLGPYLLPETRTCKVSRMARMKTPAIDQASWLLEKESVLLAGSQTPCQNGQRTKKVSVLSCDGTRTLFTDSTVELCERPSHRITTCVYTLEPGVVLLEHSGTLNGVTSLKLRVHDVRKKKRLFHLAVTNGSGLPGGEPDGDPDTSLEDVDQDGIPEIVTTQPETGQRLTVRKWRQGRFVEAKSP